MLQLNHMDVCSIKVPQSAMDTLTQQEALDLALGHEEVREALGDFVIRDTTLEVRKGYDLTLIILLKKPEGKTDSTKLPKEKKKKKKKLKAV